MKLKLTKGEIDEPRYMNALRFKQYVRLLMNGNQAFPKNLDVDRVEDRIKIAQLSGDEVEQISDEEYYSFLAKEKYGAAVRDNTKDQLVEIGKRIEDGTDEDLEN